MYRIPEKPTLVLSRSFFYTNKIMVKLLTKSEVTGLIQSIKRNFKANDDQRAIDPLARHIQYPKIPSILSESIVFHLIKDKKILTDLTVLEITSNHKIADIVLHTQGGLKKVEVKSTGKNAFQYFGEKDIKADYLIWLHFNTLFVSEEIDFFEVFLIKNTSNYFSIPVKINLKNVLKIVPNCNIGKFTINGL